MEKTLYNVDGVPFSINELNEVINYHGEEAQKGYIKKMLFKSPKLAAVDRMTKKIIYTFTDIQQLYLYPLTILHYVVYLASYVRNEIPRLPIIFISFDKPTLNANEYFKFIKCCVLQTRNLNAKLCCVEFTLDFLSVDQDMLKEFIALIYKCKIEFEIKVCAIIKGLPKSIEFADILSKYADYLRFNLYGISEGICYYKQSGCLKENLKFISRISNHRSLRDSLIIVKTFMQLEDERKYQAMSNLLSEIGVDIFQISKKLQPLDIEDNPSTPVTLQNELNDMTKLFDGSSDKLHVIHVKDISTLYYPRFMLDERNSRKCYSAAMKPAVLMNSSYPCTVTPILNNPKQWSFGDIRKGSCIYATSNASKIRSCAGNNCSDCASIFENDFLYSVENFIKVNREREIDFYIMVEK